MFVFRFAFFCCLIGSPDLSLSLLNPLIQLCSQHGQNYSALFRVSNYSPCKGDDVISVEIFFNLRRGNRYSHSHSRARCSRSRKQAHNWPRCSRCRPGTRRGRSPRLNITPFVSLFSFFGVLPDAGFLVLRFSVAFGFRFRSSVFKPPEGPFVFRPLYAASCGPRAATRQPIAAYAIPSAPDTRTQASPQAAPRYTRPPRNTTRAPAVALA